MGCASTKTPEIPTTPAETKVKVPSNLVQKCPEIPPLKGNTFGDVFEHDIEMMGLYAECAKRHDRLIDAVK